MSREAFLDIARRTLQAAGHPEQIRPRPDQATTGGRLFRLLTSLGSHDVASLAPAVWQHLAPILSHYLDIQAGSVRSEYLGQAPTGPIVMRDSMGDWSCFGAGMTESYDAQGARAGTVLPCTLNCPHGPSCFPANGQNRGHPSTGSDVWPDGEGVGDGVHVTNGIGNYDRVVNFEAPLAVPDAMGQGSEIVTDACPALMQFYWDFGIPPAPSFSIAVALYKAAPTAIHEALAVAEAARSAPAPAAPAPGNAAPAPAPAPGNAAPWADPACVACAGSPNPGFNTVGQPCPYCANDARMAARGCPVPADYEVENFSWRERQPAATVAQTPPGAPVPAVVPPVPAAVPTGYEESVNSPVQQQDEEVLARLLATALIEGGFVTPTTGNNTMTRGVQVGGWPEALKRLRGLAKNRHLLAADGTIQYGGWQEWYLAASGEELALARKCAGFKALVKLCGGEAAAEATLRGGAATPLADTSAATPLADTSAATPTLEDATKEFSRRARQAVSDSETQTAVPLEAGEFMSGQVVDFETQAAATLEAVLVVVTNFGERVVKELERIGSCLEAHNTAPAFIQSSTPSTPKKKAAKKKAAKKKAAKKKAAKKRTTVRRAPATT